MKQRLCRCEEPHLWGAYDEDELVAMPVGRHWVVIHIPCGYPADEALETD